MKPKSRFKITFPSDKRITFRDISYDPDTNMVTITGKTLRRLERRAKAAGLSLKDYFNQRIHELIEHDKQNPGWLERWILECARKEMQKRLNDLSKRYGEST